MFGLEDNALSRDISLRHRKVKEKMAAAELDAILVTANTNLYYLTGQILTAYLYLPLKGDPILFYTGNLKEERDDLLKVRKPEEIPGRMKAVDLPYPGRIGLEEGDISAAEWKRLAKLFPTAQWQDASQLLREARSVKTPLELDVLRETGRLHGEIYSRLPERYEKGMTDLEFSAALEHSTRIKGGLGLFRTYGFRMEVFMGSVLAGENGCAASPYDFSLGGRGMNASYPLGPSGQVMKEGDTIVADIAFNLKGYLTDLSRTYAVECVSAESLRLHAIALEIEDALVAAAKPGVLCSDLYQISLDIASERGVPDLFMGKEKQAAFVGHGVGIEINELPVLTGRYQKPLEENMVIAMEPKLIGPNGPVGVENTYIVTKEGLERITPGDRSIVVLKA